jgi:hypothetical protein
MKGTMIYGPRDTRFERSAGAYHHSTNGCHHSPLGHMYLRIGPHQELLDEYLKATGLGAEPQSPLFPAALKDRQVIAPAAGAD